MKTMHTFLFLGLAVALLLGLMPGPPAHAALGAPGANVITGTVQNIDYLHRAITVNGQTYAVANNATFNGIGGFPVLHVGMTIAFSLSSPASNSTPGSPPAPSSSSGPQVITQLTWLPGAT